MPVFVILMAYILGSVPFGLLLSWAAGVGDIRNIGSGNIGATNVLRTGRKGLAILTLLLDAAKGYAAVFVCKQLLPEMAAFAAVAVVIGHIFPVWLGFKGGKGVATTLGATIGLDPVVAGLLAATWLLVFLFTRISSLSALVAAICGPFYAFIVDEQPVFLAMLAFSVLVIFRHHSNIRRLISGEEPISRLGRHNKHGKA